MKGGTCPRRNNGPTTVVQARPLRKYFTAVHFNALLIEKRGFVSFTMWLYDPDRIYTR